MSRSMLSVIAALIALATLPGCPTVGKPVPAESASGEARPCALNLTVDGGFLVGTWYRTHQEFPGLSKLEAFDRIVAALALDAWQIVKVDKELGIISAETPIAYSGGRKAAPLTVTFRDSLPQGVRIDLGFHTPGGTKASVDHVRAGFCTILEAIAK
jgi:hypothetical protein